MKKLGIVLVACVTWVGLSGVATAQVQPLEFKVTVQGTPVVGSPSDTYMTFSAPVGLPQVGLAPGTYVFRFLSPSVVQVLSSDREKVYTTFFTAPTSRGVASRTVEVTFTSVGATAPLRMVSWFQPDRLSGQELIYPKAAPAESGNADR